MRSCLYAVEEYVQDFYNLISAPIELHHGAARGGDMMIDSAAIAKRWTVIQHPVTDDDWGQNPRAALDRNIAMLEYRDTYGEGIDLVFGIRRGGESSRGTTHCVNEARKRGIPVIVFDYPAHI